MSNSSGDKLIDEVERLIRTELAISETGLQSDRVRDLANRIVIHVASVEALIALFGPPDSINITIPLHHTCQCGDRSFVRHEFGRGSFCTRCGLPA